MSNTSAMFVENRKAEDLLFELRSTIILGIYQWDKEGTCQKPLYEALHLVEASMAVSEEKDLTINFHNRGSFPVPFGAYIIVRASGNVDIVKDLDVLDNRFLVKYEHVAELIFCIKQLRRTLSDCLYKTN